MAESRKPEILKLNQSDLRPFDVLDEGRSIRRLHVGDRIEAEIGVLVGECTVIGLKGCDPLCLVDPTWRSLERIELSGEYVVARGVQVPVTGCHGIKGCYRDGADAT